MMSPRLESELLLGREGLNEGAQVGWDLPVARALVDKAGPCQRVLGCKGRERTQCLWSLLLWDEVRQAPAAALAERR